MLDTRNLVRFALHLLLASLLLCCAPLADGGQFDANLNGHGDGDVDLADFAAAARGLGHARPAARLDAGNCLSNDSFVLERPRRGALRHQHWDGE